MNSIEDFAKEIETFATMVCEQADREAEAIHRLAHTIEQATARQNTIINKLNQTQI